MKQKTREELVKEVAKLEQTFEEEKRNTKNWSDSDKTRREIMSKVLGAPQSLSYGIRETETYSWSEIFTEIGKLLANQEFASNHTELHQIKYNIQNLQAEVFKDKQIL